MSCRRTSLSDMRLHVASSTVLLHVGGSCDGSAVSEGGAGCERRTCGHSDTKGGEGGGEAKAKAVRAGRQVAGRWPHPPLGMSVSSFQKEGSPQSP